MNKNYTIQSIDTISMVRFIQPPTYSDVKNAIDELVIDESKLRLWDLTTGMNLSSDELRKIAEYGKQMFKKTAKVAIVAPSDLSFGLSRMHEVYRETNNLEQRVFRIKNEAIEWLKNQNA